MVNSAAAVVQATQITNLQSEVNNKGEADNVVDALNRIKSLETKVATLETSSSSGSTSTASLCTAVSTSYDRKLYI